MPRATVRQGGALTHQKCPRRPDAPPGVAGPGRRGAVGLSMAERRAVTRQMAKRYAAASKGDKGVMLDQLCSLTGWSRRHARRALRQAGRGEPRRSQARRARVYGPEVAAPLRVVWATLDGLTGKRLAPFMAEAVQALERS